MNQSLVQPMAASLLVLLGIGFGLLPEWASGQQRLQDPPVSRPATKAGQAVPEFELPAWGRVVAGSPNAESGLDERYLLRIRESGLPWRIEHVESGIQLVLIPKGSYWRGVVATDEDASGAEKPRHEVVIGHPFYLGVTEVTEVQWGRILGAVKVDPAPAGDQPSGDAPHSLRIPAVPASRTASGVEPEEQEAELPTRHLGTSEVLTFLRRSGLELPRDSEWEYAAHAGRTELTTEEILLSDWVFENSGNQVHAVATKGPNPWGLHDMFGNVMELVGSRFALYGQILKAAGPDSLVVAELDDGLFSLGVTVRGGNFALDASFCRPTVRTFIHVGTAQEVKMGPRGEVQGVRVAYHPFGRLDPERVLLIDEVKKR